MPCNKNSGVAELCSCLNDATGIETIVFHDNKTNRCVFRTRMIDENDDSKNKFFKITGTIEWDLDMQTGMGY